MYKSTAAAIRKRERAAIRLRRSYTVHNLGIFKKTGIFFKIWSLISDQWSCMQAGFWKTLKNTAVAVRQGCMHRISTARKETGWGRHFFYQIEPNWPMLSTVPVTRLWEARPAGWVNNCSICASTMPRAPNRAGKGSIILWRRFTFHIFILFIYVCMQP